MKYITFENNIAVYKIPLSKVADNRARYYADRENETQDSQVWKDTYQEEFQYVMEDEYEGTDWLLNNTDPEDFCDSTRMYIRKDDTPSNDWNDYEDFQIKELQE